MKRSFVSLGLCMSLLVAPGEVRAQSVTTTELTPVGRVGAVASGLGGLALLVSTVFWFGMLCKGPRCGDQEINRKLAIGFTAGGAALLGAGIPMFVLGKRTTTSGPVAGSTSGLTFRF